MGLDIPTTTEQTAINLANLEAKLNQTSPLADESFQRTLAGMEGLAFTSLYKFGVERALQNLVLTATKGDLDNLGIEFGVLRKVAESAQLTITIPGTTGTIIPINTDFVGDPNGIRYFSDAQVTVTAGVAAINVTASESGVAGNLLVGDTLSIGTQIAGVDNQATVTVVLTLGVEEETDDAYRDRILFALRITTGGGNAADYKSWSEEVSGVFKAYVFAGQPFDLIVTSYPGDRTIYIQADADIDADGIAPASLLDEVRTAVNTDPDTLKSRPPLGLVDATVFIESIIRTEFFITITGLDVSADIEAQVKTDISSAADSYFRSIGPFVEGIDLPQDRNDLITSVSISTIVQDVLTANGGTAQSVGFGLAVGSFLAQYRLNPNELAKLGLVTYA